MENPHILQPLTYVAHPAVKSKTINLTTATMDFVIADVFDIPRNEGISPEEGKDYAFQIDFGELPYRAYFTAKCKDGRMYTDQSSVQITEVTA